MGAKHRSHIIPSFAFPKDLLLNSPLTWGSGNSLEHSSQIILRFIYYPSVSPVSFSTVTSAISLMAIWIAAYPCSIPPPSLYWDRHFVFLNEAKYGHIMFSSIFSATASRFRSNPVRMGIYSPLKEYNPSCFLLLLLLAASCRMYFLSSL